MWLIEILPSFLTHRMPPSALIKAPCTTEGRVKGAAKSCLN